MPASLEIEESIKFLPTFDHNGLIPVIVVEQQTKTVLMFAYTNQEGLDKTFQTKQAHFYSRSRQKIWKKGEESGFIQNIKQIYIDCDQDALIFEVEQVGGAACHTGRKSCFYRLVDFESYSQDGKVNLKVIDNHKIFDPAKIYKS